MAHQMWVRPLCRKMWLLEDTIAELAHKMRDAWEAEDGEDTYDVVFKLTEEISKVQTERVKLMKELSKGRH